MDVGDYLKRAKVQVPTSAVIDAQRRLWAVLDEAKKASLPATPSALNRVYLFKVPKLSADGSCSLHDELDPTPYDLSAVLGGRTIRNSMSLVVLHSLVAEVAQHGGIDWLGVYQTRTLGTGRALVKLAYEGVPSRAEFPLTEAFAKTSNNSTVGREGTARVLNDVHAHVKSGGAYYECDPRVRAEACVPVLGEAGEVLGIVDAESSTPGFFDDARLSLVVALALEVSHHFP
jgi:putative methionine-R-sulfoxide reductase with GAF domain